VGCHLVVINERFYGVDQPVTHFVDFVKNEERLRAERHITANPVLKVQLEIFFEKASE
jgi:hypothetical protein